ncbi:MAG: hypothetical protein ACREID_03535, partial [Planctomycetota bacterium]
MIRAGLLLSCCVAAGCRTQPGYRAPDQASLWSDPRGAYARLVEDGRAGIPAQDEALWRCELGSAAL